MPTETTSAYAREHFDELCSRAVDDVETIFVKRTDGSAVAIISADELASLEETAHLLRSPKNAERLLRALGEALARTEPPMALDELRRQVGLSA